MAPAENVPLIIDGKEVGPVEYLQQTGQVRGAMTRRQRLTFMGDVFHAAKEDEEEHF